MYNINAQTQIHINTHKHMTIGPCPVFLLRSVIVHGTQQMCRLFEGFCSCAAPCFVVSVFVYLWCFSSSHVVVPGFSLSVHGTLFPYLSLGNVCEAECVCSGPLKSRCRSGFALECLSLGVFVNEKVSLFHILCLGLLAGMFGFHT